MRNPTPIPEWLTLGKGSHRDACGVCLEECYSLLVHEVKSDSPNDVHPIIREIAIAANDAATSDEDRTSLAATLGCQRDTNQPKITTPLAIFVIRHVVEHLPKATHEAVRNALVAAGNVLEDPSDENRAEAARAAQTAEAAQAAEAARAARAARVARAAEAAQAAEAARVAQAARAAWVAQAARAADAASAAEAAWAAEAAGAARVARAAEAARAAQAAEAAQAARAAEAAQAAEAARAAQAAQAAEAARAAWVARAAQAAEAARVARAAFYKDLLFATIDEAERLLGRTECWVPTEADWERVRAACTEVTP